MTLSDTGHRSVDSLTLIDTGGRMGFWGLPIDISVVQTDPYSSDVSTRDTIDRMRGLVYEAIRHPTIVELVGALRDSLPARAAEMDYVRKVFHWVKGNVSFIEDETLLGTRLGYSDVNQELLIAPWVLVTMPSPQGDCDDFSTLIATLCKAVDIPICFVTIAADKDDPSRWSHVYTKAIVDGRPFVLDGSHGAYPGWETRATKFRHMEWSI